MSDGTGCGVGVGALAGQEAGWYSRLTTDVSTVEPHVAVVATRCSGSAPQRKSHHHGRTTSWPVASATRSECSCLRSITMVVTTRSYVVVVTFSPSASVELVATVPLKIVALTSPKDAQSSATVIVSESE